MGKVSIKELETMSTEERTARIRERVIEMYIEIGNTKDALVWMWRDLADKQKGD
jgi:hypothetical protein